MSNELKYICQSVGNGHTALKYLAPHIFRVAISNSWLAQPVDDQVTFRYRPFGHRRHKECTLPAETFIHRSFGYAQTKFLQHGLPNGLVKVRYYGLFSLG